MIELKLYRQTEGFCGPSSFKMVMEHYGIIKSEREFADLIKATRKRGCTPEQILAAAEKLGFNAYYKKDSNFTELSRLVDRNIPPIVYWDYHGCGHYSVFCGFKMGRVVLADPKKSVFRKMRKEDFLYLWRDPDSEDEREIIVIERRQ